LEDVARIVLGFETNEVAEEVMHFLDRTGRARVVATAADDRQLAEAVRQLGPDAVVASPALLRRGGWDGAAVFALDTRESVAALRTALRVGAKGFYLWPADREELAGAAARIAVATEVTERRARVIAVLGSRGGSGATFVATHLASAFAGRGRECVLVDMDPLFADATAALGAPEGEARTVADLLPSIDELTPGHVGDVLWGHPDGFSALLAPEPEAAQRVRPADYHAVLSVLPSAADSVVLAIPRSIDEIARVGLDVADRVLIVLTLDVLSFRDAKRLLERLGALGFAQRIDFVVNRSARAEITPRDVERVFGSDAVAVLPADAGVRASQDRGRLLPRRGRMGRAFGRLVARLEGDV